MPEHHSERRDWSEQITRDLPAVAERPASSDELPTGAWLKELQDDGYRPYTWSGGAGWLPVVLDAVVVVATVLAAWLLWHRIPPAPLHCAS